MKEKKICRCCKKNDLYLYINLGNQPLANSYHKGGKLPKYPLQINVCRNCYHNQLSIVVDKERMFKNYLYVSGTTQTFRNHTKNLALDAVKRFTKKKLNVLDIACNDGTQLEYFRELGCGVMGVDPAVNLREITKTKNIPVVVDYWVPKVAESIKKRFNIITGTNVFAHVDNLDEFLQACKISLKKDGVLILEFPYADKMIEHNEFDTAYHEHLSYFIVNSFKTLMERTGFYIYDVLQTPIHGGSIRFFVKQGSQKHSEKINKLIEEEEANGLLNIKTYKDFQKRVKKNKSDMKALLLKLSGKNKKIVGYGASAKGNTMLNYFVINLDYIVDDNDLKWGYKTPGRNIIIKNPKDLNNEKNELYIVILSWNFYNEIVKKIKKIRGTGRKDASIVYVPDVKILPVDEGLQFFNSA